MANINTPITAAATSTQLDDTTQNPTTTSPSTTHGKCLYITLVYGPGVTCDPEAVYDLIEGGFTTVASQKELVARDTMILKIEA